MQDPDGEAFAIAADPVVDVYAAGEGGAADFGTLPRNSVLASRRRYRQAERLGPRQREARAQSNIENVQRNAEQRHRNRFAQVVMEPADWQSGWTLLREYAPVKIISGYRVLNIGTFVSG